MISYEDFCGNNQDWKKNLDAKAVFDFLCEPESIYAMIIMSKFGLPALGGIVKEIEEKFSGNLQFPLDKDYNRQLIGRMAKEILAEFGYTPIAKGSQLRDFIGAKLFKTASIYKKTNESPKHFLSINIV